MDLFPYRKYALPAILLLGILARIYWFGCNPSLWTDEVSVARSVVKYDLATVTTKPLDLAQMAPAGYLFMEKSLGALGGYSERSLRLFSLICGIASVLVFAKLARELLTETGQLFAVTLFCFSGPLIFHAGEAKQYATEALAAVLLLWLAARLRNGLTTRQAVGAGLVGMICVWFAFSAVFVLAGVFGVLALRFIYKREFGYFVRVVGLSAMALASFVVYYTFIIHKNSNITEQTALYDGHFALWPVSAQGVGWYVRTLYLALDDPFGLSFDINLPFLPHAAAAKFLTVLAYPALALGLIGVVKLARTDRFTLVLLGMPMVLAWAASLDNRYPLLERHLLFITPAVYLLLALAIDPGKGASPSDGSKMHSGLRVLVAWTLVYVLVNLGMKVADPKLFGGRKYSEMREAMQYIAQHEQKGDQVFILWNTVSYYEYYNFRYHLDWHPIIGDDPRPGAHSMEEVTAHARNEIQSAIKGNQRVWFLTEGIFSQISYLDEHGVKHDTQEPAATIYRDILQSEVKGGATETFTAYEASVSLVNGAN
jgi:hypothetical protein